MLMTRMAQAAPLAITGGVIVFMIAMMLTAQPQAGDLEAVLRQPEVAQRLLSLGSLAEQDMSVAQFDAFMRGERERWAQVVKQLDITAN